MKNQDLHSNKQLKNVLERAREKESITVAFDRVIEQEDASKKQREKKTEMGVRHCCKKRKKRDRNGSWERHKELVIKIKMEVCSSQ